RFRQPTTSKKSDRTYPLTGLLRCRQCNMPMRGQAQLNVRYYRDPAHAYGRTCDQVKQVAADDIERRLVEFFRDLRLPGNIREGVIAKLKGGQEKAKHADERARLSNQLDRTKRLFMLGDISETE